MRRLSNNVVNILGMITWLFLVTLLTVTVLCFVSFVWRASTSSLFTISLLGAKYEVRVRQDGWLQPMRTMIHPLWVSCRTLTHLSRWDALTRKKSVDRGWQRLACLGVLDSYLRHWFACNIYEKLAPRWSLCSLRFFYSTRTQINQCSEYIRQNIYICSLVFFLGD